MKFVFKGAISLFLLLILFRQIDTRSLVLIINSLDIKYLFLAILINLAAWLINTYKWQKLFLALNENLSFLNLLSFNFISMFYALFLPGQISGEVVKGVKIGRVLKNPPKIFASIFMDRFTGVLALIIIGLPVIFTAPPSWEKGLVAIGVIVSLSTFSLFILSRRLPTFERGPFSKVCERYLAPIRKAFKVYRDRLNILGIALLYSFIFQLLATGIGYVISIGLCIKISYLALIWIVACASLVQMMPISIAGIGVREGAFVFLLAQYGIPQEKALVLSLTLFAIQLLFALFGGALELLR